MIYVIGINVSVPDVMGKAQQSSEDRETDEWLTYPIQPMYCARVRYVVGTDQPSIIQKDGSIPSCYENGIAILRLDQIAVGEVCAVV